MADLMTGLTADEVDRIRAMRLLGVLPTPDEADDIMAPMTNRDRRRYRRLIEQLTSRRRRSQT